MDLKHLKRKTKQFTCKLSQLPIAGPWLFGGFKSLAETKVTFTDTLA